MPKKLVNLRITEVSGVDKAANKRRFLIVKRDDNIIRAMKTEDEVEFPAAAFAYVPDPKEPSTWKLRLWEDPEKKVTAAQVGRAVAALGEGFRGNKVEIPADDLPKVKARVRAAWKEANPDKSEDDMPEAIRKGGVITSVNKIIKAIAKLLGRPEDEVKKAMDEATSFKDELKEAQYRKVTSEVWDYVYALERSICSTIMDDSADREVIIRGSLDQFAAAVESALPTWLAGKTVAESTGDQNTEVAKIGRAVAGHRLERLKEARALLEELIAGAEPQQPTPSQKTNEEDVKDVKIDKNKLTPEELATLEAIEKKAGIQDPPADPPKTDPPVNDDVWKGVNPAIRKMVEDLQEGLEKANERAEKAETEVAKARDERLLSSYVAKAREFTHLPVGDPEKFGQVLKKMAESDPEGYKTFIESLEASNEAVKKGALFTEMGRSGGVGSSDAWTKIEKTAEEIRKNNPSLSKEEAIDKAAQANPDLVAQYRAEQNKGVK